MLDFVVEPDRSFALKDRHELELAVDQGVFSPAAAAAIEADGAEVAATAEAWGTRFRAGWETFRPDPAWPIPQLSAS